MKKVIRGALLSFLAIAALSPAHAQEPAPPRQAVPIEPIGAIVDAFRTHQVVGLSAGESHGDERGPAFVVSLIRDPRFIATTIDVVMENGNARYQDLMDRFVRGEDVPYSALRRVWDDTTQPQAVSGAIGEIPAVYRALRDVNASLPRERQHRAILGDPPIEWENVRTRAEFQKWLALRDIHPAEAIRREVLAKGRGALVVYGSGHLQRRQQATNYDMDSPLAQTVISLLTRAGGTPFVVVTVGDRFVVSSDDALKSWPIPSVALIRGTTTGAEPMSQGSIPRVAIRDGKFVPIPRELWIELRLEEQIDAVLYLGPSSTATSAVLSPAICSDRGYVETRLERIALAGLPPAETDRLRKLCAIGAAQ